MRAQSILSFSYYIWFKFLIQHFYLSKYKRHLINNFVKTGRKFRLENNENKSCEFQECLLFKFRSSELARTNKASFPGSKYPATMTVFGFCNTLLCAAKIPWQNFIGTSSMNTQNDMMRLWDNSYIIEQHYSIHSQSRQKLIKGNDLFNLFGFITRNVFQVWCYQRTEWDRSCSDFFEISFLDQKMLDYLNYDIIEREICL